MWANLRNFISRINELYTHFIEIKDTVEILRDQIQELKKELNKRK